MQNDLYTVGYLQKSEVFKDIKAKNRERKFFDEEDEFELETFDFPSWAKNVNIWIGAIFVFMFFFL